MTPQKENSYEALGVSKGASDVEIKRAFRGLSQIFHPDNGSKPNEARYKKITEARAEIETLEKRKAYDAKLRIEKLKREAKEREAVASGLRGDNAKTTEETDAFIASVMDGTDGGITQAGSGRASGPATSSPPPSQASSRPPRSSQPRPATLPKNPWPQRPGRPRTIGEALRKLEEASSTPFAPLIHTPPSAPLPREHTATSLPPSPSQQAWWIGIGTLALVGIIALVIVVATKTGQSGRTRESLAAKASAARHWHSVEVAEDARLSEERLTALSLVCLERYVCHVDPVSHMLPVFISGMDANLVQYLVNHGYSDAWTDNTGGIHGQTIGPQTPRDADKYIIYQGDGPGTEVGIGLYYTPPSVPEQMEEDEGIGPWDMRSGETEWTITWTLYAPSGAVIRELEYTVPVVNCETDFAYCEKVKDYESVTPDARFKGYNPPAPFRSQAEGEEE